MPAESRQGSSNGPGLYGNTSAKGRFKLMKLTCALLFAMVLVAADKKPLPGVGSNEDIAVNASVILDRMEIRQALGAEIGAGYVLVRLKATPKTEKPLRISPEDFTLVSRKDGERGAALVPAQIAGQGTMV